MRCAGRGGRANEGAVKTAWGTRGAAAKEAAGECPKRTAAAPTLGLLAPPLVQLDLVLLGDGAVALRLLQALEHVAPVVRCIKGAEKRQESVLCEMRGARGACE